LRKSFLVGRFDQRLVAKSMTFIFVQAKILQQITFQSFRAASKILHLIFKHHTPQNGKEKIKSNY